jgi:hypothetical protein
MGGREYAAAARRSGRGEEYEVLGEARRAAGVLAAAEGAGDALPCADEAAFEELAGRERDRGACGPGGELR